MIRRTTIVIASALLALLPLGADAALSLPTLTRDVPAAGTPNIESTATSCLNTGTACRNVSALARDPLRGTLYAGGIIDRVTQSGQTYTRTNLVAFNSVTSAIRTGFNPVIAGATGISDGEVEALTMSPDRTALYVGGRFNTVNGITRRGIAKLDPVTGAVIEAFNARIGSNGGPQTVLDIKFVGSRLWIAGTFTSLGGVSRKALASVDPVTGAVTSAVNVNVAGELYPGEGTKVRSIGVNPGATAVVIAGAFTAVGGHERLQVAKFGLSSTGAAVLSPWYSPYHLRASSPKGLNTTSPSGGCWSALATAWHSWPQEVDWAPDGGSFYLAAGAGYTGFPALCDSISKWSNNSRTNDFPLWIQYSNKDTFWSVAATGRYVYGAGHMKTLNYRIYHSAGTAVPTLWYADNTPHPWEVPGTYYYGELHYGLGALDATTGKAVPSWNDGTATSRGVGWDALLAVPIGPGNRAGLWIGGDTEKVNGQVRKRIAYFPTS